MGMERESLWLYESLDLYAFNRNTTHLWGSRIARHPLQERLELHSGKTLCNHFEWCTLVGPS